VLTTAVIFLALSEANKAIDIAMAAFAAFVLAHLALDLAWARFAAAEPPEKNASDAAVEEEAPARCMPQVVADRHDMSDAMREGAGAVIQTSGLVLGLVASLATNVTPGLKVGSIALAASILVCVVLYMYVLAPLPELSQETLKRHAIIRYLFNAALFTLAFGLLSVATSIALK
jgi:hypothetical protein